MELLSRHPDETARLGELLGRLAPAGTVIALHGPLGAGKTHLVQGLARGADVKDPSLVSSPTYVLMNIYAGTKPVYHIDAYRLESEEDADGTGIAELLTEGRVADHSEGLTVIEWATRIASLLPPDHLALWLEHEDAGETDPPTTTLRRIRLEGTGDKTRAIVRMVESNA